MADSRSTEEIQYEKLTSFFEKLVKWISIVFSLLVGIFGFVFFQDRNSMQEERTALQVAYNLKVEGLEKDIAELKTRSQETINKTQIETQTEISNLKKSANGQIIDLKSNANSEISTIKIAANDLALKETAKQVANVFKEDKIQKIIESKATDAIQEKIPDIVSTQLSSQAENIIKINSWASLFRQGNYNENREHLRNFDFWLDKEFKRTEDKQRVIKLNYEIKSEYNYECTSKSFSIDLKNLHSYFKDIPENSTNEKIISILTNKIETGRDNLHDRCLMIQVLARITGNSYWCFDDFRYGL